MLFHISFSTKAFVAQNTFERALLGVTPIMDLQGAITGEGFQAKSAGCVGSSRWWSAEVGACSCGCG